MSDAKIQTLCGFSRTQGCASKMRRALLKKLVSVLPGTIKKNKDKIISDYDSFDDAAIYKLTDEISIVFTVDFMTPVTNDPERFGHIAIANALSDIYAKGAAPCLGLNVLGFPQEKMDLTIVERILKAGFAKAEEANAHIVGGHTLNISEFIYGLAAIGFVKNNEIILNSGAYKGDVLLLTKPLGTNVVLTLANRAGVDVGSDILEECLDSMCQLNIIPDMLMKEAKISACTDISGYGFIGHLAQMLEASKQKAIIYSAQIPVIKKSLDFYNMAYRACSVEANKADYSDYVQFTNSVSPSLRDLLFDAHTSGGLLMSVPEKNSKVLLEKLQQNKFIHAAIVGRVIGLDEQESLIKIE
ncbi:MAG: selenide, water dikinase SelD [Candidatus Omnitrophota bacterium]